MEFLDLDQIHTQTACDLVVREFLFGHGPDRQDLVGRANWKPRTIGGNRGGSYRLLSLAKFRRYDEVFGYQTLFLQTPETQKPAPAVQDHKRPFLFRALAD
ncbi:hypothetical protein [Asticcacaulis sp. AC402]|uniref:hypothetical protein n=1 Tax=Asticcacaulis sp. AC402 TaxID=1282361 RepID=UPI0004CEAB07|nr:hypothetical protein [Asticcacaulis sp. AC402]